MKDRIFLDTNILVYADDADAGVKQQTSQQLVAGAMSAGNGVVSTQVLQEYFAVATRKLKIGAEVAQRKLELLAHFTVVAVDVPHIVDAIKIHRLYNVSFWDALVVQAARRAGCAVLLSEDMQHGQKIEGITIHNPFV